MCHAFLILFWAGKFGARGAVLAAAARVLRGGQELDGALQLHRGLAVLAGGRRPLRPRPPAGTEVRDGKGGRK